MSDNDDFDAIIRDIFGAGPEFLTLIEDYKEIDIKPRLRTAFNEVLNQEPDAEALPEAVVIALATIQIIMEIAKETRDADPPQATSNRFGFAIRIVFEVLEAMYEDLPEDDQ